MEWRTQNAAASVDPLARLNKRRLQGNRLVLLGATVAALLAMTMVILWVLSLWNSGSVEMMLRSAGGA